MDELTDDPLWPYLAEIIACPEAEEIILSGGFGLRLKQYYLNRRKAEAGGQQITLMSELPETRATLDLDLFLNVNIWVEIEKAHALSKALQDTVNYKTLTYSWQFRKPMMGGQGRFAKLDMLSRQPLPEEPVKVKDKNPKQVGRQMGTGISGRLTPEAFAIDDSPLSLEFVSDGQQYSILVPHPYSWLNMKVRAAYDWLREQQGLIEPKLTTQGDHIRLKHVYDVYVLTAMLTQAERAEAAALAEKYADHEEALKTREQAVELYGTVDAEGVQAIEAYSRRYLGRALAIDHELFWDEGLKRALGLD